MGSGAIGYAWEEAEREECLTRGLGWVWGAGLVVFVHDTVVVYLRDLQKKYDYSSSLKTWLFAFGRVPRLVGQKGFSGQ